MWSRRQGEVICGQCVAGFELSPRGVACDPAEESTPPDWLVPVVVVLAVVLLAAVAVAVTWVVRRRQHPPRPRPPLPRPDELGVLPSDWTSKKLRRSTFGRNRYTRTPKSQRPPPQVYIYSLPPKRQQYDEAALICVGRQFHARAAATNARSPKAGTKMSPFWILLELRMMEVVRDNIKPAFCRPDALPVAQPTVSNH